MIVNEDSFFINCEALCNRSRSSLFRPMWYHSRLPFVFLMLQFRLWRFSLLISGNRHRRVQLPIAPLPLYSPAPGVNFDQKDTLRDNF